MHLRTSIFVEVAMSLKFPGPVTVYALTTVMINDPGGRSLSVYCVSDVLMKFTSAPIVKPSS